MNDILKFNFKSLEELLNKIKELNLELNVEKNIDLLLQPIELKNGYKIPNSICSLPMEGFDADETGGPSEISLTKYKNIAAGGAGLIWIEATAVVKEGRSNPRQFWINKKSFDKFKKLISTIKETGIKENNEEPIVIIQLTHSGRYSKPDGKPAPVIAHHSPILDPLLNIPEDYPLISDSELDILQEKYIEAALLAEKAGFDGIDIKSCHGYLLSELLATFTRTNSKYGGSFENRTKFLLETIQKANKSLTKSFVTTRLSLYDTIQFPYGFGVKKENANNYDLTEPLKLINLLKEYIPLLGISIGNPYYKPYFGRPFDIPVPGTSKPEEHPLKSIERIIKISKEVQIKNPDLPIVGFGYTWLRQYFPYFASFVLKNKWISLIGLGREIIAYPDVVKDLKTKKELSPNKVCITCSQCSALMRKGEISKCVVRKPY